MREIIFRGKDLTGSWWYGNLISSSHEKDGRIKYVYSIQGINDRSYCSGIDEKTIGQFTGLKDKDGKYIYEGDIVLCREYRNNAIDVFGVDFEKEGFTVEECKGNLIEEYISPVFYDEANFYVEYNKNGGQCGLGAFFSDMRRSQPIFEIEVIGNVIDNPTDRTFRGVKTNEK